MKIVRGGEAVQDTDKKQGDAYTARNRWKVLVIDDEPDVLGVTRLSLGGFSFAGRGIQIIEAGSAAAAKERLAEHADIALALIDVVMETDDAGLRLVEHIRQTLNNSMMRLMIRTGQPGAAPERFVIDHFDIDDYKDKTELTDTRLYTSVRSGIKAYRDLVSINNNRIGLERILEVMPSLFQLGSESLPQFFSGVMSQVIGLCQLSNASHIGTFEGVIATFDEGEAKVQACTDRFNATPRLQEIHQACLRSVREMTKVPELRQHSSVFPLTTGHKPIGYIYVEPNEPLTADDINLIHVLARQCSQALENFRLHGNIVKAFDDAIDMLAEIAEFKDKTTGDHINRIDQYTRLVALAMGIAGDEATRMGVASRLHDVGKIGIPDHILSKPGRLTPDEFAVIKTHTTIGASILAHDKAFEVSREVALHHHERWDGHGYPDGTPARQLPLVTRIVSVVDVFDALINKRPYKDPWGLREARQAIADSAGSQFDPDVVRAFIRQLDAGEYDKFIGRPG